MNKLPVFEWYLDHGDVLLTVNSQARNVSLPPQFRDQENVNLVVGLKPTPELSADEWGVVAPMRFSGAAYTCKIPWMSVMQMSSQDAVISFRDIRKTDASSTPEAVGAATIEVKDRSHLRVIK